MTAPNPPRERSVLCPICLDVYPWPHKAQLFEYKDGSYAPITPIAGPGTPQHKRMMRTAYLRCPNPSEDLDAHYLPALYATFNRPLVVGLVGGSTSGKSHLLASMIAAIETGGLQRYGLTVTPLDFRQHSSFINESVARLRSGDRLGSTLAQENAISYADALLLASNQGTWPVTFFDVAGGDLARHSGNATRFLDGANALIFVIDPDQALAQGQEKALTDPAFATVLGKLGGGGGQYVQVPTAVVMSKADRYRFRAPVGTWLARPPEQRVDAEAIRQESCDVYGFIHQHDGGAWLRPFHECRRCTLHFASATGGDAVGPRYPRGVRPRRVLEPLVALLAMCQVISGPEAERVGIW
jgi:hypothetical protein